MNGAPALMPSCWPNTDGAAIVAAWAGAPFATVVDLWRRSNAYMIWTTAKKNVWLVFCQAVVIKLGS